MICCRGGSSAEGQEYISERQRKCRRDSAEPWKADTEVAKTDAEAEEANAGDVEDQEADAGNAKSC